MDDGRWTVDSGDGQWTVEVDGLRSIVCGQLSLDGEGLTRLILNVPVLFARFP